MPGCRRAKNRNKIVREWIDLHVSEKEDPLIDSLIDTLGTLIKDYEDRTIREPKGDAVGCLKNVIPMKATYPLFSKKTPPHFNYNLGDR